MCDDYGDYIYEDNQVVIPTQNDVRVESVEILHINDYEDHDDMNAVKTIHIITIMMYV